MNILTGPLAISIFMAYIIRTLHSCDETLYVSSQNKICSDSDCTTDVHTFTSLQVGSTLCFMFHDQTSMQLSLRGIETQIMYRGLYQTCDYEPVVSSARKCFGAVGCWSESQCTVDSKWHDTEGPWKKLSEDSVTHRYGCRATGIACVSDACGYWQTPHCVWTLWELQEKRCYTIYKKTISKLKAHITLKTDKGIQEFYISPGFPTITQPISVLLSTVNLAAEHHTDDYILEIQPGTVAELEPSPLNVPQYGSVGEYQKQLNNNTRIFPVDAITCIPLGCESKCLFRSESAIIRFLNVVEGVGSKQVNSRIHTAEYDNSDPMIRIPGQGSVSLFLKTKEIDYLYIDNPNCKLSVTYIFGCIGCNVPTKVGIKAIDIQAEGLISVYSNCSLTSGYLRCQVDPYEIEISGSPTICHIFKERKSAQPVGKNDSIIPEPLLIINIDYIFEGSLKPLTILAIGGQADNWLTKTTLTLSSSNFLYSFGIISLITTLILCIVRILLNILAIRSGKSFFEVIQDRKTSSR